MPYCTPGDLEIRLTPVGYLLVADRDRDGSVDADELEAVQEAIDAVSLEIDEALQGVTNVDDARASGSVRLRVLCVDMAIERLTTVGGGNVSDTVYVNAKRARDELNRVKRRESTVPGLRYTRPRQTVPAQFHPWGEVLP